VSSRPYLCSIKRASEDDLGSPLQSGGRTLRRRKDSGDAKETFLLAETFDRRSTSISGPALPALFPNRPLRNRACTPLFLLLTGHGNPSQWTTCWASCPTSREMTVFLWLLITFLRWRFWLPGRRKQQRPLSSYSLNESGYILESHKLLSQIRTFDFSAHSSRASGHYWPPSSPNPRPSTPRHRWPTRGRKLNDCAYPSHV
jgi:hypothetical protein